MWLSIWFHPATFLKKMKRAVAVFQESHELSSCGEWACGETVPTNQTRLEERDASPQNSFPQQRAHGKCLT